MPRRRGGLARALFGLEPLPLDPERPAADRPHWLQVLFALERLPRDPEPARPRRRHWLARLFALESLDPPP